MKHFLHWLAGFRPMLQRTLELRMQQWLQQAQTEVQQLQDELDDTIPAQQEYRQRNIQLHEAITKINKLNQQILTLEAKVRDSNDKRAEIAIQRGRLQEQNAALERALNQTETAITGR